MSSSADFSDDDDYSYKSGSASPAPGDTLPWNLPRHERYKRKIHGGSVLDPAERAVLRIAGEEQSVSLLSGCGMELFLHREGDSELIDAGALCGCLCFCGTFGAYGVVSHIWQLWAFSVVDGMIFQPQIKHPVV